jgi:hypothetical protein
VNCVRVAGLAAATSVALVLLAQCPVRAQGEKALHTARVALPATNTDVVPAPPVPATQTQLGPIFKGYVDSRQTVRSSVSSIGDVTAMRAVQIFSIGTGDFYFSVPAPAKAATTAPGTELHPGLRPDSILWQGFSDGVHQIGASVILRPIHIRRLLPLSIRARETVNGRPLGSKPDSGHLRMVLAVNDRMAGDAPVYNGDPNPLAIAHILDKIRQVRVGDRGYVPPAVELRLPEGESAPPTHNVHIQAPLRLSLHLRLPARSASINVGSQAHVTSRHGAVQVELKRRLGDGEPFHIRLVLTGTVRDLGTPRISLVGIPAGPVNALRPPAAQSWAATEQSAHAVPPQALLRLAETSLFQLALSGQYDDFLANPSTQSVNSTRYEWVSARTPTVPPGTSTSNKPLSPAILILAGSLAVVGCLAVGSLLAVVWAHS